MGGGGGGEDEGTAGGKEGGLVAQRAEEREADVAWRENK